MVGAATTCVLATVVLILAVVLGLTLVLLPFGIALGYLSFRLYKIGFKLAMPRPADVKKGVHKQVRSWKKGMRKRLKKGRRSLTT